MTIKMKAGIIFNRKLGDYQKRIYLLLWLDSSKKERLPNVKHQFDGGAL
jgi:hypothetical protein